MALQAKTKKVKKLKRDHRTILDLEVLSTSAPARKASQQTMELTIEYDSQPIAAVAAIVTHGLAMVAKLVERFTNIQGSIRRDLWRAFTELSADLAYITGQKEGEPAMAANKNRSPRLGES